MSEKKYQIFISSTYKDLKAAREVVTKQILNMYHIPIGMEMFSADNNEQWDTIKATIDDSDYYILIIGHRYGSKTNDGVSYTEKEFNYAKRIKVPILTFIRNRDVPTKPDERDDNKEDRKKLDLFIAKASSKMMIEYWEDEKDLSTKVSTALQKSFHKHTRVGWIRADQGMSPKVSEEIAVLSKENRELKDILKSIQDKQQHRIPKFEVFFNDKQEIKETYISDSALIAKSTHYLKKIDFVPAELKPYVDNNALLNYNDIVKQNGFEIVKFNRDALEYERNYSTNKSYNIRIKNVGNMKANNIVAELDFPSSVTVIPENKLPKTLEAKKPSYLPKNPLDQARLTLRQNQRSGYYPNLTSQLIASMNHQKDNFEVENNQVIIQFGSILHTRSNNISIPILLIPQISGYSEIKVKIICEEFQEPDILTVPINIVE